MFEVTASWAVEAAACGLWLVGLLKIWSLTFQVRMSHRHWSHNCSCAITQARWEERTSEQICGLASVSDNTVCVHVCASVCVCARGSHFLLFFHIHPLMQHSNYLPKHYYFLFFLLSFSYFYPKQVDFFHDTCKRFMALFIVTIEALDKPEKIVCIKTDDSWTNMWSKSAIFRMSKLHKINISNLQQL